MSKSRFDELIKTWKVQSTLKGTFDNAVTEASKLLEINYTTRQVDQELELCKMSIIEHMKRHEASAATLAFLEAERNKISASHDKLSDFADNARPQMMKIAEARDVFLSLLNDDDDSEETREFDAQNARELREAIDEVNKERELVLADLGRVEQSTESLETEFMEIASCIKLQKTENAIFHATLQQKLKDMMNRCQKLLVKYDELLKSKERSEAKSDIKVEKSGVFFG